MSDSKLRELERRWREKGSVEDEITYLRERLRVGELTRERLELAAYCGHEGAKRALLDQGTAAHIEGELAKDSLRTVTHKLARLGRQVLAVAGNAVLEGASKQLIQSAEVASAIAAIKEWLRTPSSAARDAVLACAEAAWACHRGSQAPDRAFAAALVEFGELLQASDHTETNAYRLVRRLAQGGLVDPSAAQQQIASGLLSWALDSEVSRMGQRSGAE